MSGAFSLHIIIFLIHVDGSLLLSFRLLVPSCAEASSTYHSAKKFRFKSALERMFIVICLADSK